MRPSFSANFLEKTLSALFFCLFWPSRGASEASCLIVRGRKRMLGMVFHVVVRPGEFFMEKQYGWPFTAEGFVGECSACVFFGADYEGVKDALGDACACSFSYCCVKERKTRCGAMAGAACCDDRCSALRWPMQRAAPKEAWFCFRQVRSSEGKLGGGAVDIIKRCSGFFGMLFWVSWYAVQGFLVYCSKLLGMLFKVSRYVAQGLLVCCSRSLRVQGNVRGLGSAPGISFCLPKQIRNENGAWPNPFLIIYMRAWAFACFSSSVGGGQQDAVGQRRGCRAGVSRQQPLVRRSTRAWLQPAC